MTIVTNLSSGFNKMVDRAGKPIRIRYFSETIGSVWDDEVTLSEVTGSEIWTSGIVMPLKIGLGYNASDVRGNMSHYVEIPYEE